MMGGGTGVLSFAPSVALGIGNPQPGSQSSSPRFVARSKVPARTVLLDVRLPRIVGALVGAGLASTASRSR